MTTILRVSLFNYYGNLWIPTNVHGYNVEGSHTIKQLMHDDWDLVGDLIESGKAKGIDFEKNKKYSGPGHHIFDPVGMQDKYGADLGTALEGYVSINMDPEYWNLVVVKNQSEDKMVKLSYWSDTIVIKPRTEYVIKNNWE